MKFFGKVWFVETVDNGDQTFVEKLVSRNYYGGVVRDIRRWSNGESINDNPILNNQISIVADRYAYDHYAYIRCVEYMGVKWKVSSVDASTRPRLVLNLGELYNEGEVEDD